MRTKPTFRVFTLLLLAALAASAQKLTDEPGYVPFAELGLFPRENLSVEINLGGGLIKLVAAATKKDDPELSSLLGGLKNIQLQVLPLDEKEPGALKAKVDRAVRWLEGKGWTAVVKVREGSEETFIYLKQTGDQIVGLTVLSFSPGDEAALINIVGRIDPEQLSRIGEGLDLEPLKGFKPPKKPPAPKRTPP
jgi:hypothetical protein